LTGNALRKIEVGPRKEEGLLKGRSALQTVVHLLYTYIRGWDYGGSKKAL
jgi:hypothetical protein